MKVFVAFDDTDNIDSTFGTGKLTRWFEDELPQGCSLWGVVRQQLPVMEGIPYTSHNSSACAIVDAPDHSILPDLIQRAVAHVEKLAAPGSDPGLCVACDDDPSLPRLMDFGLKCSRQVVTQQEALSACEGIHLSGHGGTNDGIIGAAAGVGLCVYGRSGRFIEFSRLRDFPSQVTVSELEARGIIVISVDREALTPAPDDVIDTQGWLRPRLWGGRVLLPVNRNGNQLWETVGKKHKKKE
ncbi:MAG TPA: hypothetical protein PKZ42_06900 [Syntrophales bacterium]|nr:hypothetical protein [Geobacteraceae bacterium]HPQ43941.1 hypothetical protein [Syntrophales bacterium]